MDIAALEATAAASAPPMPPAGTRGGACTSAHDARSVAGLVGLDPRSALGAPRSGIRVAVVGAGVAGLACAHDLLLLGHDCVLIDSAGTPGGVLTSAVPAFRFPVNAARAESAAILAMGAGFEGGRDIAGSDDLRALLSDGFHAVFLATGASEPREPAFGSRHVHPRVLDAMQFLSGRTVLTGAATVVGEGVLAVDAARSVVRRAVRDGGAGVQVRLLLREKAAACTIAPEMLAAAAEEGVRVDFGWECSRFFAGEAGALRAVEVVREAERSALVVPCDHLVVAGPRAANATAFWPEIASGADGLIAVDPDTLQTSMFGVWAGGACAFGHRSIAHAAADGKRAAWHIHAALTRQEVRTRTASAWVEVESWNAARAPRALATRRGAPSAGALPPADPFGEPLPPVDPFAEHDSAAREAASREAARCLDCSVLPHIDDSCTSCGKCVKVCEPGALSLGAGPPAALALDQDVCTRCGECVHACPEGSIAMLRLVWEERLELVPSAVGTRPSASTPAHAARASAGQGSG